MKQIQIIIPDRALKDVDEILRESQVGGGTTKAQEVAVGRGTMRANEISGKIFVLEVPITFDISTRKKGESAI
jgi:nitrogen regulatory protein PII